MIKKSFRLMLLVAFALSSVMFVACNKYDEDINDLYSKYDDLSAAVQSLKAAVDGGAVITSVSNTAEGVKFTLSNGQSYTVNHGTPGANGANGADGKNGSVVTIGENGNWFIDGVDTGMASKGDAGKSPRINEAGNWEIWDVETQAWVDTKVSAVGASTYVVDKGSYYELNVMEKVDGENAEYTTINLPKTTAITSLTSARFGSKGQVLEGAIVKLNYGKKLAAKRVFNGVTYAKGTNLVAKGSSMLAFVNPISTDASKYTFKLVDSKGNAPYVISSVSAHKSTNPLTKAKTPNNGLWNMSVELSSDLEYSGNYELDDYAAERSKWIYSLTTETYQGTISSAYDVDVTEQMVEFGQPKIQAGKFVLANVDGKAGESIDLMEAFEDVMWQFYNSEGEYYHSAEAAKVTINGATETVKDLTPYIKDCYFALKDNTAASQLGVTLDGTSVIAQNKGSFEVRAYFLLVDGYCADGNYYNSSVTFKVNVDHVAAESTLAPVEWTVNGGVNTSGNWNNNVVYLDITNVKSLMNPTSDNDIVYVTSKGWTWTDETALDSKTVVVNNTKYGEAGTKFAGNESNWIATIENGKVRRNNSNKDVATSFARSQVVKFTFNPAQAFPGEYLTTLEFRLNSQDGDAVVTVPVKVVITAPSANALVRVPEFFDGDNAVVYGNANGTNVTYDLFGLYKSFPKSKGNVSESTYVSFDEDIYDYYKDNGSSLTRWISGSEITVKTNPNNFGYYNHGDVYTTRTIYVEYKAFNNPHIPYVYDEFNLTVKSEIAEGVLDGSNVNAVIPNSAVGTPVEISWKNIIAKDVYGQSYNLGSTYTQNAEGEWKDSGSRDSRIEPVVFTVADGDDKFIEVSENLTGKGTDGYGVFTVKRKAGVALTTDVDCTVVLKVTDKWGRVTKTNIKVTLKK